MHTLFTPVARIEVLQAMRKLNLCAFQLTSVVLSMWGDTSWRPGGELCGHLVS